MANQTLIDPFYPCLKYKMPADPKLDGTDHFIVAESMSLNDMNLNFELFECYLSFTCENDQKAFYKLKKDCLQIRIKKIFFVIFVNIFGPVFQSIVATWNRIGLSFCQL